MARSRHDRWVSDDSSGKITGSHAGAELFFRLLLPGIDSYASTMHQTLHGPRDDPAQTPRDGEEGFLMAALFQVRVVFSTTCFHGFRRYTHVLYRS
jgi:hypothetical protein